MGMRRRVYSFSNVGLSVVLYGLSQRSYRTCHVVALHNHELGDYVYCLSIKNGLTCLHVFSSVAAIIAAPALILSTSVGVIRSVMSFILPRLLLDIIYAPFQLLLNWEVSMCSLLLYLPN